MGARWPTVLAHARATLLAAAPKAASAGLRFAIENHQDLGSEELVALSEEAGPNVGVVLDTGNPFAVGEDPVAFAARVAHRLQHVHLKDYQAQFTSEGVRLIRCAIGDGCVPIAEIVDVLSRAGRADLTASLELGALESRHVRLFAADWWEGYPPRDARELGVALGRLRRGGLPDEADARTPWERSASDAEVIAYEREGLRRSVAHVRARGWMPEHTS
jgi:3-oxoisoapionate decarboxylase